MRTEPAEKFIVAHFGIYDEILPPGGHGGPVLCRADGGPAGPHRGPHHPRQDGRRHLPAVQDRRGGPAEPVLLRLLQPCPISTTSGAWGTWRPISRTTRFSTAAPQPPTSGRSRSGRRFSKNRAIPVKQENLGWARKGCFFAGQAGGAGVSGCLPGPLPIPNLGDGQPDPRRRSRHSRAVAEFFARRMSDSRALRLEWIPPAAAGGTLRGLGGGNHPKDKKCGEAVLSASPRFLV